MEVNFLSPREELFREIERLDNKAYADRIKNKIHESDLFTAAFPSGLNMFPYNSWLDVIRSGIEIGD